MTPSTWTFEHLIQHVHLSLLHPRSCIDLCWGRWYSNSTTSLKELLSRAWGNVCYQTHAWLEFLLRFRRGNSRNVTSDSNEMVSIKICEYRNWEISVIHGTSNQTGSHFDRCSHALLCVLSMYEKLISRLGIDEIGTNFPQVSGVWSSLSSVHRFVVQELYDPHWWGQESYYEELSTSLCEWCVREGEKRLL